MAQKAFAVGDLIINDWEDIESSSSTIVSILSNGIGLPATRSKLSQRYGRWPLFGSMSRRGHGLTLNSRFYPSVASTAVDRETLRRNLIAEINPELEDTVNLYAADQVMPYGNIAAFGPWDVRVDSAGAWTINDILNRATATVNNALHIEAGEQSRQKAIVAEGATTNVVTNPSIEVDVTSWSAQGSTRTRDTTEYKFGAASLKVVTNGGADNQGAYHANITVTASQTHTASAWIKGTSGDTLRLRLNERTAADADVGTTSSNFAATGSWQRLTVSRTFGATGERARVLVTTNGDQTVTFYVDGVQLETNKAYATTYCDGSLGPGYTWSGTAHASTSSRTATEINLDAHDDLISDVSTLSMRTVIQMPYDANDANWVNASINALWDARGSSDSDRIRLAYDPSSDFFRVYINGSNRIASSAQTTDWDAGDWLDLVVTLDFTNDSYALYIDGSADGTSTASLSAPTLTEWNLGSNYAATNQSGFAIAEYQVWNRVLTAAEASSLNTNGTGAGRCRYVESICESAIPLPIGGTPTDHGIISTYRINDDVRWRSRDGDASFWSVYDDTWTHYLTNDGDDDAYPVVRIKPITAKTGGYSKKRWVAIKWKATAGQNRYPTLIVMNTATEVSGGDMQADGDDLRVWSDGQEIDRWFGAGTGVLYGPNHATTNIWVNLNWQATVSLTLKTAIGAGDTVTEIELNESIDDLPESGILYLDDTNTEAFTYTAKNAQDKKVTGVTRATKGTSAGAHTAADTVYWIQHDLYIVYGNGSATAPSTDDDYKPVIELDGSTNTLWEYDVAGQGFGEDDGLRAGQWQMTAHSSRTYTDDDEAIPPNSTDPWDCVGGLWNVPMGAVWFFRIWNACGFTEIDVTDGEKRSDDATTDWVAEIRTSPVYDIPAPGAADTWTNWIVTHTITPTANSISLYGQAGFGQDVHLRYVDIQACTLTIDSTYAPSYTVGAEEDAYDLDVTLTNSTTGDVITVTVTMGLSEYLEIDTKNKTVVNLTDNTSELQALTVAGGPRRDWLRLIKGDNTITWSDTGTETVDVEIVWHRRYWE
jgi:hypothetical protein